MANAYLSPMLYYPYYFAPTPQPKLGRLHSPSLSPRTTKRNAASPLASPYTLPIHPNIVYSPPNPYTYVIPPPYTPVSVYAGLSPNSSISEELQEPEELHVDKWEAAREGFLYDNRDSPVGLNSVHSMLEVNPVLARGTIPLIVDLSRGLNEISTIEEPGQTWSAEDSEDILSQPATIPRVTKLRLLSPKTKYTVEVVSRTGVTVSAADLLVLLANR